MTTQESSALAYPLAPSVDQRDVYHGVEVTDPYRWMEDLADRRLVPWLAAQEQLTDAQLAAIPGRNTIRARLEQLSRLPVVEAPRQYGARWFQRRNPGDLEQPALCVLDSVDAEPRVLVDPRTLSPGVLIAEWEPSPDGSLLLWAETAGGSDWKHWRVMEVDSGRIIDEAVRDGKLWALWMPGGDAFLYIGFATEGDDQRRATRSPQLRLHRLGAAQQSDELVFENPQRPRYFFPAISEDGRTLVLTFVLGSGEICTAPIDGDGWTFTTVVESESEMWYIGGRGDELIVATTDAAPWGRVVAIDSGDPRPQSWRTVVPEMEGETLRPVARSCVLGDHVLAARDKLGRSAVSMHRIDGTGHWDVPLPEACHFVPRDAAGVAGVSHDGRRVYFAVTTPDTRVALLHHDVQARTTETVFRSGSETALEVRSDVVWARSEDGTAVPMTLVRSARAEHNGAPAVIVEGYGGGGDSMRPFDFVPWKVAWLERGGVIASAHLRGGSELGADWVLAATRAGKLLAMQDFVACAAHLVDTGFTVPAHLGITGRSSGAMLAAAAVVARPDLFGACVAEVGMFDPLRYHLFGLGSLMIAEYGTSDDARDFAAMHAYAPYTNVRPGTEYPAFLITVHDDDDRVAPGGAYKFTAALQAAQRGTAPILLRRRSGAGHHGGDVTGDITEYADIVAFFAAELNLA